jgi:hypothetical protein
MGKNFQGWLKLVWGPGTPNLDQAPLTRNIGSTRSGERRKA